MQFIEWVIMFFQRIKQKFCFHRWAYKKSVVLMGHHRAEHVCIKCRKIGHVTYGYDSNAGGDML